MNHDDIQRNKVAKIDNYETESNLLDPSGVAKGPDNLLYFVPTIASPPEESIQDESVQRAL